MWKLLRNMCFRVSFMHIVDPVNFPCISKPYVNHPLSSTIKFTAVKFRHRNYSSSVLQLRNMDLNTFEVIRKLGNGGYGRVMLVKSKKKVTEIEKNQLLAMKIIPKKYKESILREIDVSDFKLWIYTQRICSHFVFICDQFFSADVWYCTISFSLNGVRCVLNMLHFEIS